MLSLHSHGKNNRNVMHDYVAEKCVYEHVDLKDQKS